MTKLHYFGLLGGGLLLLSSCVDDKYDLSDIDTTTAIKLKDLVVPVKLNDITLDEVLKIDEEGSIIGEYTNLEGQRYYAIKQEGYFSADPVKINELKLIDPVSVPALKGLATGTINNKTVPFSYKITNVDPSLLNLTYFGLKAGEYMEINLEVSPSNASISDLKVKVPSFYVAEYKNVEYTDGVVPVNVVNGALDAPIYIKQMNFQNPLPNIDNTLDITDEIGISSANINTPDVTLQFSMSPFTVNVVSGSINYKVEAPYINPVELNDLPDFLTEGETNLILQNPQLYLDFSYLYGAKYKTGITIDPEGIDVRPTYIDLKPFTESIVLAADALDLGLPNLYESPELQDAPQLQYVLSGKGLPTVLNIYLDETYLKDEISKLVLGTDPGIELAGSYTFFTPLAFAEGSEIIYSKTENDFFGDDMEDVVVDHLQLQANVTTNLPFAVTLTVYPLDKEGNILDMSTSSIPAGAQGNLLNINFSNKFKGLDGVRFEVKAEDMNGESLTPEQYLRLENIKATVSGEYVTKL